MSISELTKVFRKKVSEKSPEILMGAGIAGMLTSTVLAVKATPKVYEMIKEEEEYLNDKLTPKEKVKIAWKPYLPAALTFGVSAACLIGSNHVKTKRGALLATAYSLSERALLDYKDKVIEVVGEDKEREIRDAVSRDRMNKEPMEESKVIVTGYGDSLCLDLISGRYFRCDMNKIQKAVNDLNYRLLNDLYASVNDFYELLGLGCIPTGFELGWNIEDGQLDIYYSAQITDDGQPCIVINHNNMPKANYQNLH